MFANTAILELIRENFKLPILNFKTMTKYSIFKTHPSRWFCCVILRSPKRSVGHLEG